MTSSLFQEYIAKKKNQVTIADAIWNRVQNRVILHPDVSLFGFSNPMR